MRVSILVTVLSILHVASSKPPERPSITNTSALPVHFGVVAYPGFVFLDAFSVVDILNTLSVEFDLWPTMHFEVISEKKTPSSTIPNGSNSTFGQSVVVTSTYDEYVASQKPLDVLIVPGGYDIHSAIPAAAPFIKAVYPRVQYILTVCVGALITAQSGILDGRNATMSKSYWAAKIAQASDVKWQKPARWVADDDIWSASGSASGIDLVLAWIGHVYGQPVAEYLDFLYEFTRARNATNDEFSGIWEAGA